MKRYILISALGLSLFLVLLQLGCNEDNGDGNGVNGACPETNLDIAVCDPGAGPFSLVIDNDFLPLEVGSESVLEGVDDEGVMIRLEISVLDETEEVAGVTTRVVVETEFEDGEVVSNEGAWRAGEDGNLPGIFMPADPQVGDVYQQEAAPGVAEDQQEVIALGEPIEVPAGAFEDTLTAEDCNPLEEGATDEKVFVRGIGLAIDEDAELVSF